MYYLPMQEEQREGLVLQEFCAERKAYVITLLASVCSSVHRPFSG
jgi:hypothetical protein